MDTLSQRSVSAFQILSNQWTKTPQRTRLAFLILGLTTATTAFTLSLTRFLTRYRAWLSIGAGGLPYNLLGYAVNVFCEIFVASADTLSLDVYDRPEKFAPGWGELTLEERVLARRGYLGEGGVLPRREGERARARGFAVPQREKGVGEFDGGVEEAYIAAHTRLQEAYEDDTEWHTSLAERHGPALFIKTQKWRLHPLNAQCRGGLNHIHASDLSGHAVLSFADAREVIAKGWGERHRMSGTKMIPLGYTMVYQPRSVEEVEVFVRILTASLEFGMSCGRVVS